MMEKTEDNVETNGQQISYTSEKFIAVQKRVFANLKEFDRKMELGRYVKLVVDKKGLNENGLGIDTKEALKTYELHGGTEEEDMYKCTFCGYASKRKFNVNRHEKVMHYVNM